MVVLQAIAAEGVDKCLELGDFVSVHLNENFQHQISELQNKTISDEDNSSEENPPVGEHALPASRLYYTDIFCRVYNVRKLFNKMVYLR